MSAAALEREQQRRLRWQCRRGLLELDLLFTRFLEQHYGRLSEAERANFGRLLACSDQALLAWVQGLERPPEDLRNILMKVVQ